MSEGEPAKKRSKKGEASPPVPAMSHPADAFINQTVREGQAVVERAPGDTGAFYNPIQEFNRDLSIANLNVFSASVRRHAAAMEAAHTPEEKAAARATSKAEGHGMAICKGHDGGIRIVEGLAATGLRSVRYAKEIEGVTEVLANDMDPNAVASIARAAKTNGVEAIVKPSQGDASFVLHQAASTGKVADQFDVVDLDPYGSPAPFLDGAVQAVSDGGILCVTFTDMAVLCGAHSEACFTKYESVPLHKSHYCHEFALRIGVTTVARHAARYRKYIQPLLCVSVDYYMRLFLRVCTSPKETNLLPNKLSYVAQCVRCDSFHTFNVATCGAGKAFQPGRWTGNSKCDTCGGDFMIGGPIWTAPIQDPDWIRSVLKYVNERPADVFPRTKARINAMLGAILDEIPEVPLFMALDALCHTLKISMPTRSLVENVFKAAGYKISVSHTNPQAIKTDAPQSFIWAFMKKWAVPGRGVTKPIEKGSLADIIFTHTADNDAIDLDAAEKAEKPTTHQKKEKRFLPNPEPHWGPGSRAGRKTTPQEKAERRKQRRETSESDQ